MGLSTAAVIRDQHFGLLTGARRAGLSCCHDSAPALTTMQIWPASPASAVHRKASPKQLHNRGELHPRATLTNHEVELMRQLHDEDPKRWTFGKLGRKFGVNRTTALRICKYERR